MRKQSSVMYDAGAASETETVQTMTKRPIAVTILSWIYILMGTVGFIYHFREFRTDPLRDTLLIEGLRLLAIVAGYFMLKAKDWARWLAIAWMGLHVAISFYNGWAQVATHAIFFVIITVLLTRTSANDYFRSRTFAS